MEAYDSFLEKLNMMLEVQLENCLQADIENDLLYSCGLYNGLEIARSIYMNKEPEFFDGSKIRRISNES